MIKNIKLFISYNLTNLNKKSNFLFYKFFINNSFNLLNKT